MDHLTIPIPDGLDETQKRELAHWLAEQAQEAAIKSSPLETDATFRANVQSKIQRSRAEIAQGNVTDARTSLRDLAGELGINLDR